VTTLYQQKLTLTSPTGGGRSVGIVRLRTKATRFFLMYNVTLRRVRVTLVGYYTMFFHVIS